MIGQTISHYRITEKLGGGGMGVVYKAEDTRLKRPVALKFLPRDLQDDPQAKERFLHEAQAASALQDANICVVYDIGETLEGQVFISMEYVEGEPLRAALERGPFEIADAVLVSSQIASALAKAHEHGIVHRDIKPENIMLVAGKKIKVLDFGIAKLIGRGRLTRTGAPVGTTAYMSPEQARAEEVDQRSDIWSLGVVLFEMITGRPPFDGPYEQAIIYGILNERPASLRSLRPEVPDSLEEVVNKALEKNADERYQHMTDLLDALHALGVSREMGGSPSIRGEMRNVPSIAVLPFVNLSADAKNEYFSDGLAEEVINALSQLDGIHVTARTSAFQFRGKDADIRDIGRKLNVRTILEGSVRREGKRLRVTAQLINVSDGYHLWSERFDRNVKDVFAVQDEIAMAVVSKLKVRLVAGEREKVTKRYTDDEKAYHLYLKGRHFWNQRHPEAMIKAVDYFQQSANRDSTYVLPLIGLADVFNMLGEFGFIPPMDAYRKSRELLQRAQNIDDSVSELYASLSCLSYCYEWNLPQADRYVSRSIDLNPQSWYAHGARAELLGAQGKFEQALEEVQTAVRLDPLSPMIRSLLGIIEASMGRTEESRQTFSQVLATDPEQPMLLYWSGMVYLMEPPLLDEAIQNLRKAVDLGATPALGWLGAAYARAGKTTEALECLKRLEEIERRAFLPIHIRMLFMCKPTLRTFLTFKKKYVPAYLKAIIYSALDKREEASVEFERSGKAKDYLLPVILRLGELYPWVKEVALMPPVKKLRQQITYT